MSRESYRTSLERVTEAWVIGPYTISKIEGHGFSGIPGPLYRVDIEGRRPNNELYESLDEALVSAVGERWIGPRGAGGSGVDTPARWFLAMIGAIPAPVLPEMRPKGDESWVDET